MKFSGVVLLWIAACGSTTPKRPVATTGAAELTSAMGDPVVIRRMLLREVVNAGVWFTAPACAAFNTRERLGEARLDAFATCLATLTWKVSTRGSILGDVVVLDVDPGFELEVRVITNPDDSYRITWIGFAGQRPVDTWPTITQQTLEALRTAGTATSEIEGFAWLKVCIDNKGTPTASPMFASSVDATKQFVAAAENWGFKPFTVGGAIVPACANVLLGTADAAILPVAPVRSRNGKMPINLDVHALTRATAVETIVPRDVDRLAMDRAGVSHVSGTFQVCITETGEVERFFVTRSTRIPSYDTDIGTHIAKWRYEPVLVDGAPSPACTFETIEFTETTKVIVEQR